MNRRVSRRDLPVACRRAYSLRISTFFCVARSWLRSTAARLSGSSSTSSGRARDVGVGQLAELPHLGIRERGLRGPAPAQQIDFLHAALAERLERVVGDVGGRQLLGRPAQDPDDVDRDVADAHDRHPLLREIERAVPIVGVAVVPGDELGRGMAPAQVLTGNPHAPVGLGAGAVHDLMVVGLEVGERHVLAELDAAEETEARIRRDLVEDVRDELDLLMVRRDAQAHQSVRSRQPIVQIDLDDLRVPEQMIGGVEAGRPGADDRDA